MAMHPKNPRPNYAQMMTDAMENLRQMREDISRLVMRDSQVDAQREIRETVYARSDGVLAGGIGTARWSPVLGVAWRVERISIGGGTAAAIVTFYLNSIDPGNVVGICTLNANGYYSDAAANDLFVPVNSQLIAVSTAGAFIGNLQINRLIPYQKPKSQEVVFAEHELTPDEYRESMAGDYYHVGPDIQDPLSGLPVQGQHETMEPMADQQAQLLPNAIDHLPPELRTNS